jgi:membrane-bound lytic murein transglycosylase B
MKLLTAAFLALALAAPAVAQGSGSYAARSDVRAFIEEMVARHGFVERELNLVFARVERQDAVLRAIDRPPEKTKSWKDYRAGFLTKRRIRAGVDFLDTYRAVLERATGEFGVPAEIIAAILGVETYYGRTKGRWRVIDSLVTLAFDFPPRASYFRIELEHYLLLVREAGLDVFGIYGSYAGAIGMPQFMPRSHIVYAVDFDGDGAVDLISSPADAIGSIANFLKQHGWRADAAVQAHAVLRGGEFARYADAGLEPRHTLAELAEAGVEQSAEGGRIPANTLAALVALPNGKGPSEYRLGFHNFYVLTRYNRSALYGSVVVDLAAALRSAKHGEDHD